MNSQVFRSASRDQPGEPINLLAVVDLLWRERRLIGASLVLSLALGVGYVLFATPTYRADLLVQVDSSSDVGGADLIGGLSSILGVRSTAETEIEVLKSRHILGAAVDGARIHISVEPRRFPWAGALIASYQPGLSTPGLFGLGGFVWGSESADVNRFEVPSKLYGEPFVVELLSHERYLLMGPAIEEELTGEIGVPETFQTSAGPVELHLSEVRGRPGARFVLRRYSRLETIGELKARLAIAEKGKQSGVISIALEGSAPDRLTTVLDALSSAYLQHNRESRAIEAQKSLDFLESQSPQLKRELQQSEEALLRFRTKHNAIDLGEEAKLLLGQFVALQTRVSLLEQQRTAQLRQFTFDHPVVLAVNGQIEGLNREIVDLQSRLRGMPDTQQEMLRLSRDVQVNTELHLAMINSIQQLRLVRASKVGNVRMIDRAASTEKPIKPRRALVALAAALVGLLVGVGFAMLRMLWRGAVTDPYEIEQLLGTVVHATIPASAMQVRNDRRQRRFARSGLPPLLLAESAPYELSVESLRSLRVTLQMRLREAASPIIAITSAEPSAGKSFLVSNLAVVLAAAGSRVLVIDGDLRKGALHHAFGVSDGPGLAELLAGKASFQQVIRSTAIPKLDVMACGSRSPCPAELLQSECIADYLRMAADRYEVILLDTAPVLPVADTLMLARHAGTVLAVAKYAKTGEGELIEMRARLSRARIDLDGVLLNGIVISAQGARYGHYDYTANPADSATVTGL